MSQNIKKKKKNKIKCNKLWKRLYKKYNKHKLKNQKKKYF